MAKCPICESDIDHLICYWSVDEKQYFELDSQGGPDYEHIDYIPRDDDDTEYICPECGNDLAHNERDAIKFLKQPAKEPGDIDKLKQKLIKEVEQDV